MYKVKQLSRLGNKKFGNTKKVVAGISPHTIYLLAWNDFLADYSEWNQALIRRKFPSSSKEVERIVTKEIPESVKIEFLMDAFAYAFKEAEEIEEKAKLFGLNLTNKQIRRIEQRSSPGEDFRGRFEF